MQKWTCCGHDIIELCNRAGSAVPVRCFFCGKHRTTVSLEPQPEDRLAFELAELWGDKIRECHGDPEAHAPSFDQYGRTDVVAWRAVARRVLDRILLTVHDKPDSQKTRDILMGAVQDYAVEWASGKSTIHSASKVALTNALDRHEFEVGDKSRFALVLELCVTGVELEKNHIPLFVLRKV